MFHHGTPYKNNVVTVESSNHHKNTTVWHHGKSYRGQKHEHDVGKLKYKAFQLKEYPKILYYFTDHRYFDKRLYDSAESVVVQQRNSVAKRYRTECETTITPRKRPERRAAWGEMPP